MEKTNVYRMEYAPTRSERDEHTGVIIRLQYSKQAIRVSWNLSNLIYSIILIHETPISSTEEL